MINNYVICVNYVNYIKIGDKFIINHIHCDKRP